MVYFDYYYYYRESYLGFWEDLLRNIFKFEVEIVTILASKWSEESSHCFDFGIVYLYVHNIIF